MYIRSFTTLFLFGTAAGIALFSPVAGLALCIGCLILYLRPAPD
jgi:TMEM175 potassium channel family protein